MSLIKAYGHGGVPGTKRKKKGEILKLHRKHLLKNQLQLQIEENKFEASLYMEGEAAAP